MQGCWFLYGLVALSVLIYLCHQHTKHRFTPRLDEAHINVVIEEFRMRPGVVTEGIGAPKIVKSGTSVSILVENDGRDWRGEAKELSKKIDPTGNLRIPVDFFRHVPERVTLDSHDGLPQTGSFIFAWSMALVAVFGFIVKLSFPFEQAGLILGFFGALGLFFAEGNYGRPVVYINEDPPLTERVQTMLLRMTSFLSIAGGSSLQFYAMVSARQVTP